jgi:hypothetical protein
MQGFSRCTFSLNLPFCHIKSLSESYPSFPAMFSRIAIFLPRQAQFQVL